MTDAALASDHDAGDPTSAAGAGSVLAGAGILLADRVLQRRRQASAAPTVGPGGASVALAGHF